MMIKLIHKFLYYRKDIAISERGRAILNNPKLSEKVMKAIENIKNGVGEYRGIIVRYSDAGTW